MLGIIGILSKKVTSSVVAQLIGHYRLDQSRAGFAERTTLLLSKLLQRKNLICVPLKNYLQFEGNQLDLFFV